MTNEDNEDLDETLINEAMQDAEAERLAKIQEMYDTNKGELGKVMVSGREVDYFVFHRHILVETIQDRMANGMIGPEGVKVLSLGSGTGKLYEDEIDGVEINLDGIDISSYEGHRNPRMRFQQGSILNAPESFKLNEQYDFIDSVFVLRYINSLPESVLGDMSQRGSLVGILNAYQELVNEDENDSGMVERLANAIEIIESGETAGLEGVLKDPVIAKAFLFTNWMEKLADGGVMAHTITLQPKTSEDEVIHRTSTSVPRQVQSLRQILQRRTDLGYGDFANILLPEVRANLSASFNFLNALANPGIKDIHEDHDYFNKITDVQNALSIFERMMGNAGHQVKIDLDIMDAADTAYIKIKKIS